MNTATRTQLLKMPMPVFDAPALAARVRNIIDLHARVARSMIQDNPHLAADDKYAPWAMDLTPAWAADHIFPMMSLKGIGPRGASAIMDWIRPHLDPAAFAWASQDMEDALALRAIAGFQRGLSSRPRCWACDFPYHGCWRTHCRCGAPRTHNLHRRALFLHKERTRLERLFVELDEALQKGAA